MLWGPPRAATVGGPVSIRILLIDDDARLFELLDRYLGEQGVTLTHAPDGARGWSGWGRMPSTRCCST